MADHRIGKIFVELDLDPSRYMKSQQIIRKEAQHGAEVLEKNFKNLGLKSDAMYDLMRARAVKSFEAIRKSGKATMDDLVRAEKAKAETIKRINNQQYGHTTSMLGNLKRHWIAASAAIVAAWYAVGAAVRKASDVVMAAARYETLGVAMHVVGSNAGYASGQMDKFQEGLEKTGISMRGARQALIKMIQAQLNLSKSAELARGAQHAAVIGAMDSTEAFNQMVYGIQSANVRVLRTIGINVSFEESYKKLEDQLGRSKETFTQAEKAGARLGVTLEALTRLSGTYEAAMETAGKQLLSLNRHFDNLKVKAGAAFTPALLEAVQTITGDIKDLNKELSGESTQKIHEWGVGFRLTLIDIKIELMNVALLLDKIGGTMTTVMVGLFSFGNAIGNENSQKQHTEWMKKNLEYEKRYWQTVIDIVALEEKQLALKYSLTDAGRADAKVKADALEELRLASSSAAKALDEQRIAEERASKAATKHAKELDKEIKKANKELEAYYKNLEKTKENLNKFFRVELITDPVMKSVEQLKIKFEELEKQIYETFVGEELKVQLDNMSKWYGMEYEEIVKVTDEATQEIDELWTSAMDRVQSTMADTFMNAMKGKLNSFKDIFKSFCDVLLRYWAEMLAQMVMQSRVLQGITAGLGGIFSGFFGGGVGTAQAGTSGITQQAGFSLLGGLTQGFGNMGTSLLGFMPALTEQIGEAFYQVGWNSGYNFTYGVTEYLSGAGSILGGALTAGIGTFLISGLLGGDWNKAAVQGGGAGAGAAAGGYVGTYVFPGIGTAIGAAVGAIVGGIAGMFGASFIGGNKKRSYLGQEYTYGTYGPESGWGAPEMYEYKEERSGEDFRESAENMAQSGLDLANAMDTAFKEILGIFGEGWVTQFTTTMGQMAAKAPTFDFNISAEDKGEFKEDWRKSWQSMTESLIEPIVTVGSGLLEKALSGVITDSSVWNYFTDDFKDYLTDALDSSLADLQIDWSQVTDQESLEIALETMGLAAENIAMIVGHFEQVGAVMDSISEALELRELNESVAGAVGEFRRINSEFDQFASVLRANGVDLSKYTDLEIAHGFAIEDASQAMLEAGMSGKDFVLALGFVANAMLAAGQTAESVAAMYSSAAKGMTRSIKKLASPEVSGSETTLAELSEKYGHDWSQYTFADWQKGLGAMDLDIQTPEVLSDLYDLGKALKDIGEGAAKAASGFAAIYPRSSSGGGGSSYTREEGREMRIGAVTGAIQEILSPVDVTTISDYAKAYDDLNQKYADYTEELEKWSGVYRELTIWFGPLEKAHSIELNTLLDSIIDPLREIIDAEGFEGLGEHEKSVLALQKKYGDITESLELMGKYLDESGELTEYAKIALAAFNVEMANLSKTTEDTSEEIRRIKQLADDLLDSIDIFDKLLDSISSYRDELVTSANIFSPDIQYKMAGEQFAEAVQGLYSSDQETIQKALEDIPGLSQTFLDASLAANTDFQAYMTDFSKVIATLNTAEDIGKIQKTVAEQSLSELKAQTEILEQISGVDQGSSTLSLSGMTSGFASGGTISGPESGYSVPVTFHGIEHITPDSQMKGVKTELVDIKDILIMIMNTDGEQNKNSLKVRRIIEKWDTDDGSLTVTQAA